MPLPTRADVPQMEVDTVRCTMNKKLLGTQLKKQSQVVIAALEKLSVEKAVALEAKLAADGSVPPLSASLVLAGVLTAAQLGGLGGGRGDGEADARDGVVCQGAHQGPQCVLPPRCCCVCLVPRCMCV
jgi:hypothetical protein